MKMKVPRLQVKTKVLFYEDGTLGSRAFWPLVFWPFGQDQEQTSELPSHKNHLEDGTQSLE